MQLHVPFSKRVHSQDFNSDVPGETAELWVGTPYAAWIVSWLNEAGPLDMQPLLTCGTGARRAPSSCKGPLPTT